MELNKKEEDINELRMIELLPHGISENWKDLKRGIEISLPPIASSIDPDSRMTLILEGLISGTFKVHVFFKVIEERIETYGFVVTTVTQPVEGGNNNLLIYVLYGHRKLLDMEDMQAGMNLIMKYAKSKDCKRVIAYSKFKYVIDLFTNLGGRSEYRLLTMEV